MPTFKSEFVSLADELINDEFADFARSFVVSKDGDYDPITDTETAGVSYTLKAIPIDLETASQQFANVTNESVYVVAYKGSTAPSSLDASYKCVFDNAPMTIQRVKNDASNAVWLIELAR